MHFPGQVHSLAPLLPACTELSSGGEGHTHIFLCTFKIECLSQAIGLLCAAADHDYMNQ